jgi:CheY-like chemotaxis protein
MNVTDTSSAFAPAPAALSAAAQTAAAQTAAVQTAIVPADGWAARPITQVEIKQAEITQDEIKTVSVCDTQPVTAEGIRTLLSDHQILRFDKGTDSLAMAKEMLRNSAPTVLMLDKAFGIQIVLEWLAEIRSAGPLDLTVSTSIVIWGASITEAEALRFLQAGARGILRKTAGISVVLACLRTVAAGRSWMITGAGTGCGFKRRIR